MGREYARVNTRLCVLVRSWVRICAGACVGMCMCVSALVNVSVCACACVKVRLRACAPCAELCVKACVRVLDLYLCDLSQSFYFHLAPTTSISIEGMNFSVFFETF